MAYSELHFTDVLFPNLDREVLCRALLHYQKRDRVALRAVAQRQVDRRFGGIALAVPQMQLGQRT